MMHNGNHTVYSFVTLLLLIGIKFIVNLFILATYISNLGTADGYVHVFDWTTYNELHSWRFSDAGDEITMIACQTRSCHVAVAVDDLIKVWKLR